MIAVYSPKKRIALASEANLFTSYP